MSNQLKLYHKALPFFLIPACLLGVVDGSLMGYATLTQQSGWHGDQYYYYDLTRPQFYIYNFSLASIALTLLIFQLKYFIDDNARDLVRLFWMFIGFVLLAIVCEAYLTARFVGKG